MIRLSSTDLLFENTPAYRIAGEQKTEKSPVKKMLLVYENESEQLPEQTKIMLEKLVSACHLLSDEVEYINISYRYKGTSLGDWKNIFSPKIILVFGNIPVSRNILALKKNNAYTLDNVQLIS